MPDLNIHVADAPGCFMRGKMKFPFIANIVRGMQKERIPIIAEIKAFSHQFGDLLRKRCIADIAGQYEAGGAVCLSVVTGRWFGGSIEMLYELARCVESPILRKDFITKNKQIQISKDAGAGAVLLTRKLLGAGHLSELAHYAVSIDMVPFVEVATLGEIEGLNLPHASIIAVNNKDIAAREKGRADIGKSLRLIKACRRTNAALIASASGLNTHQQIRLLYRSGFDAFLIGTSLMKADDIVLKMKNLILGGEAV